MTPRHHRSPIGSSKFRRAGTRRPGVTPAAGFTLVELMVTLVIVAILAGLSIAGYGQYVRRANRTDATAALLRLSAAEERFFVQNGRYATGEEVATAPPAGLGITRTEHGYYELEVTADPDGDAVGYRAEARAIPGGPQGTDQDCQVFGMDHTGARDARTGGGDAGAAITERCWR